MSTVDLLAGTVLDISAALNNDAARSVYTYAAQIPYLNLALQELEEYFQLNDIPVTATQSAIIPVDAGIIVLDFNVIPGLPDDMVEPVKLWVADRGGNSYYPMGKIDVLSPNGLIPAGGLTGWVWEQQKIKFHPSNLNHDIKLDYVQRLFLPVVDETSPINIINAKSFLEYRTAALAAVFVGENKTRADELNDFAGLAIDRTTGIGTKGKQTMVKRRRAFRSAYKRRS